MRKNIVTIKYSTRKDLLIRYQGYLVIIKLWRSGSKWNQQNLIIDCFI